MRREELEHLIRAAAAISGERGEKDTVFVRALLRHGIVGAPLLVARVRQLPVAPERKAALETWIAGAGGARA